MTARAPLRAEVSSRPIEAAPGGWRDAVPLAAVLLAIKLAFLFADPYTRFLFGDSLAYLRTGLLHFVPDDRSWSYGLILEFARRVFADTRVIVGLNVAAFGLAQLWLGLALRRLGARRAVVAAFFAASSLAPSLLYYERAVLSDTLALAGFTAFLAAAERGMTRGADPARLALVAAFAFLTVSLRTAYASALLAGIPLVLVLDLLLDRRRAPRAGLGRGLALGGAAVVGVAAYAFANGVATGGPTALNRTGPRFLLGVLAPAVDCPAMRRVDPGFECDALLSWETANLHRRNLNVWAEDRLIAHTRRLGAAQGRDEYGVQNAILHDLLTRRPLHVAGVYARTALLYLDPRAYRDPVVLEHIGSPEFPPGFLDGIVRPKWRTHWEPDAPSRPSPARGLVTRWQVLEWPLVLLGVLGVLAAPLVWRRAAALDRLVLACTALYSVALPLFSTEMILRYAMPVTLAGLWLAARAVSARRVRHRPEPSGEQHAFSADAAPSGTGAAAGG